MEDPSVDIGSLTRQEVLTQLGLATSDSNIRQLQAKLRKKIIENHPIKGFLNGLRSEEIHQLYLKIATNPTKLNLDRMKKFIADQFFIKYGKAPLASLKWFIDVGRFPDQDINEKEMFYLLKSTREKACTFKNIQR